MIEREKYIIILYRKNCLVLIPQNKQPRFLFENLYSSLKLAARRHNKGFFEMMTERQSHDEMIIT